MSKPQDPDKNRANDPNRDKRGQFTSGNRANPGGRPRNPDGFRTRARELSLDVLERFAVLARERSMAGVRAGELVLAYGFGRPVTAVDLTARRAPADLSAGFSALGDAAVNVLEQALKEADEADAAKAAQLSGITEDGDRASNLESGSLDDASPTENDTGDESPRALSARFTDDERGE